MSRVCLGGGRWLFVLGMVFIDTSHLNSIPFKCMPAFLLKSQLILKSIKLYLKEVST